jgi:glycerol-1-phosphate dehydrogenase [NAD(P)+]
MIEYLHSGDAGRWRSIRDALAEIGAPTTAEGLGIDDDDVIAALSSAHGIRDRYTILGNGMSEAAAQEVAERTGVI